MQDNGPGIVKKQIPLIFGKLLYGSKFHRLRMSRGQQGIGISAAGMYGVLTTGKPVKIISKVSPSKPAHYYEIQIDTKKNKPEILNGKGEGVDIPPGEAGAKVHREARHRMDRRRSRHARDDRARRPSTRAAAAAWTNIWNRPPSPIRTSRSTTSIPKTTSTITRDAAEALPPEPKEIKPHPYGIELGMLVTMLKDGQVADALAVSDRQLFAASARRWPARFATRPSSSTRASTHQDRPRTRPTRSITAIQETKIGAAGHRLHFADRRRAAAQGPASGGAGRVLCGRHAAAGVYRGNPFQIEVALAYGGVSAANASHARRADGIAGRKRRPHAAAVPDQHVQRHWCRRGRKDSQGGRARHAHLARQAEAAEIAKLHEAMRSVNLEDGQTMNVLRYANRVPLQFQPAACAITQSIMRTNWRSLRAEPVARLAAGGPVTIMVHIASVWVPFTSESKEAVACYPEIQKELRLALQGGRPQAGHVCPPPAKVKQEGERRSIFLRYLGEVATAVSGINEHRSRRRCTSNCSTSPNERRPTPTSSSTRAASRSSSRGRRISATTC